MADVGTHFYDQYDQYLESVFTTNKEWYENINGYLTPHLHGTVLDVGNGGLFTYDVTKADKIIAVDVAFKDTSKLKPYPNVEYVCDDATSLQSIPSNSVDTVVFQFILHHITGKSRRQTHANMQLAMQAAKRVLKPGGTMVIIEPVVSRFLEFFEIILYRINTAVIGLFNKPMVYMFNPKTISKSIQANKFEQVDQKNIPLGKRIDVFNGTKPGLIIIPGWLAYFQCYFFSAKKPIK